MSLDTRNGSICIPKKPASLIFQSYLQLNKEQVNYVRNCLDTDIESRPDVRGHLLNTIFFKRRVFQEHIIVFIKWSLHSGSYKWNQPRKKTYLWTKECTSICQDTQLPKTIFDHFLIYICKGGYIRILQYIFSNFAINSDRYLFLCHIASFYGHLAIVKYLIKNRKSLYYYRYEYNMIFSVACRLGTGMIIKHIVPMLDSQNDREDLLKLCRSSSNFNKPYLLASVAGIRSFFDRELFAILAPYLITSDSKRPQKNIPAYKCIYELLLSEIDSLSSLPFHPS